MEEEERAMKAGKLGQTERQGKYVKEGEKGVKLQSH
jgi:hypothetical protein